MAERMNGYIYDGSKSLRTTDACLKGPLLNNYKHDSNITLKYEMIHAKGRSFVATIDNVLNPEQCSEIIANSKRENFKSMLEKYRSCQRNNSRVLILDDEFSSKFWETLEPVVNAMLNENNMPTQPLGFDVSRGDWKLHNLNAGFRINKYTAEEKQFFSAHKDAQYCPNGDRRSLLTVLVYLNEDFEGGLTKFHFPKISDDEIVNKGMCKDKTVEEEIRSFGGLEEGYNAFTIKPSVGKAVIFSHNILHESTILEEKTKYILKTDVVVNRHDKSYGFVVSEEEKVDYLQCLNLFREAQSLELAREKEKAGDFYERALSIRYCYPMALQEKWNATHDKNIAFWDNYMLPSIVWYRIFDFLSGKDIENVIRAYPEFSLTQAEWETRRCKEDVNTSKGNPSYIPIVESQFGIFTKFRFKDDKFFFDNEEACVRVAAMYSFYLLGHRAEDQFYTVRYNPETQEVIGVALKSLLRDVFLNRPCYGAIYAVMQQDPDSKNIAEDFQASVDRSYMTMRHGAQFLGGAIGDEMKVRSHFVNVSEEDLARVIVEGPEERKTEEAKRFRSKFYVLENGSRIEKVESDRDVIWGDVERQWDSIRSDYNWAEKELSIEALKDCLTDRRLDGIGYFHHRNIWIRQSFPSELRTIYRRKRFSEMRERYCYGRNALIFHRDVTDKINVSTLSISGKTTAKDVYMDYMIKACNEMPGVSAAIVFEVKPPVADADRRAHCMCYFQPPEKSGESLMESHQKLCYNHLVFDFSSYQLAVSKDERLVDQPASREDTKEDGCFFYKFSFRPFCKKELDGLAEIRNYRVDIQPLLQDEVGFNHAACQCDVPEFKIDECHVIEDYPVINHIHVIGGIDLQSNEVVLWTAYGGIVAL